MRYLFCLLLWAAATATMAQPPQPVRNAAEIQLLLQKLNTCATVLYVAAHPDDENTAMLAYFSAERLARTGYLSLTRGDGGQNLIGSERGPYLGLIRTQELLAARRIDRAEQFFTRAVDFGYSKNAEETFRVWPRDSVLADVVWAVRRFRPDIIVTRFPGDGRGRHGHHTASALLAKDAFDAAADSTAFPEQLAYVRPWQAKRLFWNYWRPKDTTGLTPVDLGRYNALLGQGYAEVAATSRSMHKSQGFGSARRRGTRYDYLQLTAGPPVVGHDPFAGVATGWSRVPGGERVGALCTAALRDYDPARPAALMPALVRARAATAEITDPYWRAVKQRQLTDLIVACGGFWAEATAPDPYAAAGDTLRTTASLVHRADTLVRLRRVRFPGRTVVTPDTALGYNQPYDTTALVRLPADRIAQPYWLQAPPRRGLYPASEQALVGLPETPPLLSVAFELDVAGDTLTLLRPVQYRRVDPVEGELYRDVAVAPVVTATLDKPLYLFATAAVQTVRVRLKATAADQRGQLQLEAPAGWQVAPAVAPYALAGKGEEAVLTFEVTPPGAQLGRSEVGTLRAVVQPQGHSYGLVTIDYPHIPTQTAFPQAEARAVRFDLKTAGRRIGYVNGPGDEVANSLVQVGYDVTPLDAADLDKTDLSAFDAIVTGIRAYNRVERLRYANPTLLRYVRNGGTLIMQYNTNRGLVTDSLGPYSFALSRDRVTDETATVSFRRHPLTQFPNEIAETDFNGWVQERGLYFADTWDDRYETPLQMQDPGEEPTEGSLLYARYGEGAFVYTGLSFFRQLPAGVPGAYRLFANLLAGGQRQP